MSRERGVEITIPGVSGHDTTTERGVRDSSDVRRERERERERGGGAHKRIFFKSIVQQQGLFKTIEYLL